MTSARTNRESICDECGLPISICNAKAMFEYAVRRNGREAVIAAILDAQTAPDAVAHLVSSADSLLPEFLATAARNIDFDGPWDEFDLSGGLRSLIAAMETSHDR